MKKLIMNHFVLFILSVLLVCPLTSCNSRETQPSSITEEKNMPEGSDDGKSAESSNSGNDTKVLDYAIGDIILADGSLEKVTNFAAIDKENIPIAVIAGFREDGKAFGVGVHRSDRPLQWAADDFAGYAAKVTDTVCTQDDDLVFDGDMDGVIIGRLYFPKKNPELQMRRRIIRLFILLTLIQKGIT